MIKIEPMVYPEALQTEIRAMAERGVPTEELIAFMRASGLSKPHSMGMLRRATHLSLGEAKEAVHFSPTWNDRRASDDAFHEDAIRALEQWQAEDHEAERLAS